jgi:DNA-binding NtrC family response regulator
MAIEEIRRLLLETRPGRVPLSPVGNKDEQIVEARISELPQDYNLDDLEKQQILRALDRFAGNRRKTAKALGIGERTLYRKLKEFGIE